MKLPKIYINTKDELLPNGIKNPYWNWNKEHAFDSKEKNKTKYKKKSKAERQSWWRSLTAGEQADYRYNKMVSSGKYNPDSQTKHKDWDYEYNKVLKENHYKSLY